MSLAERIALVNEKIAAAARQAGREPSEVTLVAATKVQTSDTIRQAIAAGVVHHDAAMESAPDQLRFEHPQIETAEGEDAPVGEVGQVDRNPGQLLSLIHI